MGSGAWGGCTEEGERRDGWASSLRLLLRRVGVGWIDNWRGKFGSRSIFFFLLFFY
jgi:hypothetical protein